MLIVMTIIGYEEWALLTENMLIFFKYQGCCLNVTFSVLLWTFQLVVCFCLDLMTQKGVQQKS